MNERFGSTPRPDRSSDVRQFDVVTIGDMFVDLIVSGGDIVPRFGQVEQLVADYALEMGGSCNIFVCQAAKLGLRTAVLGKIGDDDFGQLILRRLNDSGVDTGRIVADAELKTGLGVALCRANDRAILTYLGSISDLKPADIDDRAIASSRHLHYGSFFLHTGILPHAASIVTRAKDLGLTISLDTNWDPAEQWGSGLADVLPLIDVFFPNEQEALLISRCRGLDEAAAELISQGVRIVVIKRGSNGASAYTHGQVVHCTPQPAKAGGDSIGAGDSFDAGFLAGWLRGVPLKTSLEIACECGRSVASEAGGLRGQPDWRAVSESIGFDGQTGI